MITELPLRRDEGDRVSKQSRVLPSEAGPGAGEDSEVTQIRAEGQRIELRACHGKGVRRRVAGVMGLVVPAVAYSARG